MSYSPVFRQSGPPTKSIYIIDTSILLSILNAPHRNQERQFILCDLDNITNIWTSTLLLPIPVIMETGNHIANIKDGNLRYKLAEIFKDQTIKALNNETPFTTSEILDRENFIEILENFPNRVMRSKSSSKPKEGVSLCDQMIIAEWKHQCALHPRHRIVIWSLDADLQAYDRSPE